MLLKILLPCLVGWPSFAAFRGNYGINFDTRYAQHTQGNPDTASHRHSVEFFQKAEWGTTYSLVLSGRADAESAYASTPTRYSGEVVKKDSQSFFLRDNYFQFNKGPIRLKLGYQQVVWGEAFGFYYADIVNPKDLRELGLGDLTRNRLNLPMLNFQWLAGSSGFQLLYIPKAQTDLLPSVGSEFLKVPTYYVSSLTLSREPISPMTQGEFGARITHQIGSWDWSIFYLDAYDRFPILDFRTNPSTYQPELIPHPYRLKSSGLTMTQAWSDWLVRSELIYKQQRWMNTGSMTTLSQDQADQWIAVIGLDLPPIAGWMIQIQYSEDQTADKEWAFRKKRESLGSLRVSKTINTDTELEFMYNHSMHDGGYLWQAKASFALDRQFSLDIGMDRFDGRDDSSFGQYKNASRAFAVLKTYFKK